MNMTTLKHYLCLVLMAAVSAPATVSAKEGDLLDRLGLGNDTITVDGIQLRMDAHSRGDDLGDALDLTDNENVDLNRLEAVITAHLSEQIKLVVKTRYSRQLRQNGESGDSDFDFDEFIREAYVEIRNVGGLPVAVVVGKHEIAFGEHLRALPNYEADPLFGMSRINQVFGVTVALQASDIAALANYVDSVEVSVFESVARDLEIDDLENVSVRVKKRLSDKLRMSASYMSRERRDGRSGSTLGIGVVYQVSEGLVAWVEGLSFDDARGARGADWGLVLGTSYDLSDRITLVAQISHLEDIETRYSVAGKIKVLKGLEIGPQLTFVRPDQGDDSVEFGITAVYTPGEEPAAFSPFDE